MGKCVKCDKVLPPDLMVDIDKPRQDGTIPQRCIFCEKNITEFGGSTKEEHIKDYEQFLKRLKDNKNIADLVKQKEKLIIT